MECCATHLLLSECSALRAAPVKWTHPECAGPVVGPGVGPPFQTPVTILKPGAVKCCQSSSVKYQVWTEKVNFGSSVNSSLATGVSQLFLQSYLPCLQIRFA